MKTSAVVATLVVAAAAVVLVLVRVVESTLRLYELVTING